MQNLTFSPEPGTPLYRQLYSMLLGEIRAAGLAPGEKLPSRRALAAHLGLSLNTVDAAYQMLAAEGYIQARARSGFYVCSGGLAGLVPQPEREPAGAESPPQPRWAYDFSTGGMDVSLFPLRTWERVAREVMRTGAGLLNYGDARGDECLRRAIARYLHEYRGVHADAARIVVGAGSETLLAMAALLLPQGAAGVEDPGYGQTAQVLRNAGVPVRPVAVDAQGLSVSGLRRSGCRSVCVTPSHQFPTGVSMPVSRRAELLQWARDTGGIIVEDDYDSEFRFDGRPLPALQGLDGEGRVIYIGTFSRSLAPSVRVAYMVLPPRLVPQYRSRLAGYASTVSRLEQHTLSRFMEQGHFARYINRARGVYRGRRDALVQALAAGLGTAAVPLCVHTGLHMPVRVENGMTGPQLAAAAAAQGVRVHALGEYRMQGGGGEPVVVLGYGSMGAEDIGPACARLSRAWGGQKS